MFDLADDFRCNRLLVFGGRDYQNRAHVWRTLDEFTTWHAGDPYWIVQGDARGADLFAKQWAQKWCVPYLSFPADWSNYGRAAGSKRNRQMRDEGLPDFAIGFPGGAGTANMAGLLREAGIAHVVMHDT